MFVAGGKCYDYVWQSSLWRDNVRTVWCQRSDGMNVTGMSPDGLAHLSVKCLHRGFSASASVAQRELGILPLSFTISVWIFVCRKDRWELASFAVSSASHTYRTGVFGLIALYCLAGHGKK